MGSWCRESGVGVGVGILKILKAGVGVGFLEILGVGVGS